jgi:ORF6N domain
MPNKLKSLLVPDEIVMSKILLMRGKKVMIDRDLAELYGVTTFRLNEQVKRNKRRFPEDFMFRITKDEKQQLIEIYPHLATLKFSPSLPNVFTEHGAVMLASVLNSERAIEVNIQIVRIFTKMRELLLNYKDVLLKIEQLEKQTLHNTEEIQLIFEYIRELIIPPVQKKRNRIGFKSYDKSEE